MSVFSVTPVRIFLHLDWIRTRINPNTDTFYAVLIQEEVYQEVLILAAVSPILKKWTTLAKKIIDWQMLSHMYRSYVKGSCKNNYIKLMKYVIFTNRCYKSIILRIIQLTSKRTGERSSIHFVQPQWDQIRWLPQLIILLKVPPRFQIMLSLPINEKFFYPSHKETLSPVIFGKIRVTQWKRDFSPWS